MTNGLNGMYKFMIKGDYLDTINDIIKQFGYHKIIQDSNITIDSLPHKQDITDDIGYVFFYNGWTILTSRAINNFPVAFEEGEIMKSLSEKLSTDILYYAYFGNSWYIKRYCSLGELIYKHEFGFLDEIDEEVGHITDELNDLFLLDVDKIIHRSEKVVFKEFR